MPNDAVGPPQAPDYDKLIDLPPLFGMAKRGEDSPFTQRLIQELLPYESALRSGQLDRGSFEKIVARTTLNHMHSYMGGRIPDQKEAEAFATQRRGKGLAASGLPANAGEGAAGYYDEPYRLIAQLMKVAGPETAPVEAEEVAPPPAAPPPPERTLEPVQKLKTPEPDQPLSAGPTGPAGPTGGGLALPALGDDASDEDKLSAALLQLMPALVASRTKQGVR